MADTKVETKVETIVETKAPAPAAAVTGDSIPEQRKPRRSPKAAKDSGDGLSAALVEKEFHAFISKLQAKYPSNMLAYQVSNLSEGLELSVRIARKTGESGSDFTSRFSNAEGRRPNNRNQRNETPLTEEQKEARRKKSEARRAKEQERRRLRREKENVNGTDKSGEEKGNGTDKSGEEKAKEEKKAETAEVPVAEKAAA